MKFFLVGICTQKCYDGVSFPKGKREKKRQKEYRKLLATTQDSMQSNQNSSLDRRRKKVQGNKNPPSQNAGSLFVNPQQRKKGKRKSVVHKLSLQSVLFLILIQPSYPIHQQLSYFTAGTTFSLSLTSPPKRPTVTRSIFLVWSLTIIPSQ
jgi:hypothetical protein